MNETKTRGWIRPALALLALAVLSGAAVAAGDGVVFELRAASDETYAEPHDIVLSPDGELLYVADNGNDRIAVVEARTLREVGVFARGEVSAPHDVDFDSQGRLHVADTGNHRVAIYEVDGASGRLVDELRGSLRRPEGVAVHADGRVLATGAFSNNLVVFRDGKVTAETGGFSAPHDVAVDAQGGIWVADAANDRMVRLDDELRVTKVLEGGAYEFNGPRYMDFDDAGRLFIADKYSNRIKVVAPDGRLVSVLGAAAAGKGEGVFDRPEGVEIRGEDVWFSDTYNDRIVRYRMRLAD